MITSTCMFHSALYSVFVQCTEASNTRKQRLKVATVTIVTTSISCTHISGRTRPVAAKLFVCSCIFRGFEEEDYLDNLHSILFSLIKKLQNKQEIKENAFFVLVVLASFTASNWHMLVNCVFFFFLSVFMLYLAWKRGLPRKCARFVVFFQLKSFRFNLLFVSDLSSFFRTLAVNCVSDVFLIKKRSVQPCACFMITFQPKSGLCADNQQSVTCLCALSQPGLVQYHEERGSSRPYPHRRTQPGQVQVRLLDSNRSTPISVPRGTGQFRESG